MISSSDRNINARPKAKFPALHVGGLDPPPVGCKPRGFRLPSQSEPLPVPCPKPRPRSLMLGSEEDSSQTVDLLSKNLESVQPPIDSKMLVPNTSTPPEICRYSRGSFQTAIQHWKDTKSGYETWFASLVVSIGVASQIFVHFAHQPTYRTVVHQLLSSVGPSTLDLYSRAVDTTITWMKHFGSSWQDMTLPLLVKILHMAKEASRSDVQAIRLQPQALLRGLKWLAKTALMDDLQTVLNTFLISSFCRGPGEPRDRKEAMPIPFILLVKREQTIMTADSPDWLRLLLGGFLLAIWSSLRYADLQRTSVTNLSLGTNALRGVCRLTKTTRTGQPFAAYLGGLCTASPRSGWIACWLKALQRAHTKSLPFQSDYIIPVLDHFEHPSMASPLSYAGALRALRWAAQTPWTSPTLSAVEAHGLTLHSLKVTMLSAAAQLRLPRQARALQGHHTAGSTQLYSRDDTVDAVWLQQQISGEVRRGWRPTRPLQRGGQPAMPEPPFLLSGNELPDTLEIPWEPSLAYFQAEPNRAPHNEVISLTEVDSSESSSLSSSDSDTDDENQSTPVPMDFGEIQFVQNGPSGCCHVAMEAKIITPPAQTVTLDNRLWSTKCGVSLRKTATPITLAQIKWPCQRKACRAVFDAMINVSTEM